MLWGAAHGGTARFRNALRGTHSLGTLGTHWIIISRIFLGTTSANTGRQKDSKTKHNLVQRGAKYDENENRWAEGTHVNVFRHARAHKPVNLSSGLQSACRCTKQRLAMLKMLLHTHFQCLVG